MLINRKIQLYDKQIPSDTVHLCCYRVISLLSTITWLFGHRYWVKARQSPAITVRCVVKCVSYHERMYRRVGPVLFYYYWSWSCSKTHYIKLLDVSPAVKFFMHGADLVSNKTQWSTRMRHKSQIFPKIHLLKIFFNDEVTSYDFILTAYSLVQSSDFAARKHRFTQLCSRCSTHLP